MSALAARRAAQLTQSDPLPVASPKPMTKRITRKATPIEISSSSESESEPEAGPSKRLKPHSSKPRYYAPGQSNGANGHTEKKRAYSPGAPVDIEGNDSSDEDAEVMEDSDNGLDSPEVQEIR